MTQSTTYPTPGAAGFALQMELARLETRALARIALLSAWLLLRRVPDAVQRWRRRHALEPPWPTWMGAGCGTPGCTLCSRTRHAASEAEPTRHTR